MQNQLEILRASLDVLDASGAPSSGRKSRTTKTDRLKAVTFIHDFIAKKATISALTAASKYEMVIGPSVDADTPPLYIGWVGLVKVLLITLRDACDDALNTKAATTSGIASIKSEYMRSFRRAMTLAIKHGPSCVISPIVPAFLAFAHDCLGEPPLRKVLADEVWQCVRQLIQPECNRAVLTPLIIRAWTDNCFQQLTGRGPVFHSSSISTSLAGDVFQLLATHTESYDVLTQSTRGIAPSKMVGGDFGYSIICERACLMLALAESMSKRNALELQQVAFQTLTIALTDHALDFVGSSAVKAIIRVALKPMVVCWNERKYHTAAVSLARILLFVAPNHSRLQEEIRRRVYADVTDATASAIVRAGQDVRDDYIDVAAACFSLREALEFASAPNVLQGHIIIWLRVASVILTGRVLKIGTSVLVDAKDLFDQCSRAAEAVCNLLKSQSKVRGNSFAEVIHYSCTVVNSSVTIANHILTAGFKIPSLDCTAYSDLFSVLLELITTLAYAGKAPGYSMSAVGLKPEESVTQSLTVLSGCVLVSYSTLEKTLQAQSSGSSELSFPLRHILSSSSQRSSLLTEIQFFRNLVSRCGLSDEDGTGLRYRLVLALTNLSNEVHSALVSPAVFVHASAVVFALTRGQCPHVGQRALSNSLHRKKESLGPALSALFRVHLFYGFSAESGKISGNGSSLVRRARDQDSVNHGRALHSFLNDEEPVIKSFFDTQTNDLDQTDSLMRHFTVDPILSGKLVSQMLANLVDISEKALELEGAGNIHHVLSASLSSSSRFTSLKSARSGLSVLVFASNYLALGIRHGLILTGEDGSQSETAFVELANLVCNLAAALRNIDLTFLVELSALVELGLSSCCEFVNALESEKDSMTWPNDSPWKKVLISLPSDLSELSAALCDLFVAKVLHNAKKSRDIIRLYLDQQLEDPSVLERRSTEQRKRKRKRNNLKSSRKRQRIVFSSPESNNSDGLSGDSDHVQNDVDESDSDIDGFENDTHDSNKHMYGTFKDGPNSWIDELKTASELVVLLVEKLPIVREVVFECCKNGLKAIKTVESVLSPDGFERASLYTSLVDPFAVEARSCAWKILLAVSTTPSLLVAADDVWNVGRHWKNLEAISQEYASHHNFSMSGEGKRRKHYPLPRELEHTRVLFLDIARRFLECVQLNFTKQLREVSPYVEQVRQKIGGFIDIAEFFRIKHAFRMPRRVRLSYMKFGLKVIDVCNLSLLADTISHITEDTSVPISDKVANIKAALCKLLSDSEALVRVTASKVVPKVFASWRQHKLAEVEQVFDECLPPPDACFDCGVSTRSCQVQKASNGLSITESELDLEQKEMQTLTFLRDSFQRVGAHCKGLTVLIGAGELSAIREDVVPFLFKQIMSRVNSRKELLSGGFFIIVRLCLVYGQKSPRFFYRVFSRVILPRIFSPPLSADLIFTFPVALVIDENHHEDGILFDWLREEQADILPHLLVHDEAASLFATTKFAEVIGTNLKDLLLNNPASVVRFYPMLFSPTTKTTGEKLWHSINNALDGKLMVELSKQKDEVISGFLVSSSANFPCMHFSKDRKFDVERCKGFSRDTNTLHPPYYDPLIVATAIDHMYTSSSVASILPSHVLCGSLFEPVRCEQNGTLIVSSFIGFVRECRRQSNTTLLQCLMTIAKALDPALTCQTTFNRIDAYFGVGIVWFMLGMEVLVKGAVERLLFYKLVSFGFHHNETAWDAAWLLLRIQQELLNVEKQNQNTKTSLFDSMPLSSDGEHLKSLTGLKETLFYEILSVFSPTFVSIIADGADHSSNPLCVNALTSLKRLLSTCVREELWNTIVCNGPFPGGKPFKEARHIYSLAVDKMEDGLEEDRVEKTLSSLRRFHGIFHLRNKAHVKINSLACLYELRTLLTDSNLVSLSKRIVDEAWLRTDGQFQPTSNLIGSFVATLIELLRLTSIESTHSSLMRQTPLRLGTNSSHMSLKTKKYVDKMILNSVSDVLNALGLVNRHSVPFINVDSRSRTIPSKHNSGKYEDVVDGIARSFFCLIPLLQSESSIAAEGAMNSLTSMLETPDGKSLLRSRKDISKFSYFRGSQKRLLTTKNKTLDIIVVDPRNGDRKFSSTLPYLDDPLLWDLSASIKAEQGDYQPWVRQLCAVLCLNCRSDANKALAGACFGSFHFSCDVFPYLLMDIVCDLGRQRLVSISLFILEHVLRKSETPSNILRTFVHGLDVLCQIGLDIGDGKTFTSRVQKTSTGSLFVPYLYVLDIPYSDAVKACLKCGASFSAIRYCHMYVDHKVISKEHICGRSRETSKENAVEMRYSSCTFRDPSIEEVEQNALRMVTPWMREAMMQLFETDGIRAFAQCEKLSESSVYVSNLDEEWFRAFASLGVVARADAHATFPNTGAADLAGDEKLSSVDLLLEHDTFRSLIGIGNLNVATQYWDGLVNRVAKNGLRTPSDPIYSNQSLVDRMNDLRFAAAWKLEHWESPSLLPTIIEHDSLETSSMAFHQTIHNALYLLKTNRISEFPSLLLSSRSRLLNDLCRETSSVSAQQVLEVSAQLRVLHIIENASPSLSITTSNVDDVPRWMDTEASQRDTKPLSYVSKFPESNECILAMLGVGGISDQNCNPCRNVFTSNILVEDLPVVMVKSLGLENHVAQVAASVSARILDHGGNGSWARSASCLETISSAFVLKAPELDKVAWKLQNCVLRWTASDDARLRKQALSSVKDIIFCDLGGRALDQFDESSNTTNTPGSQQALSWKDSQQGDTKEAFLRSEACRLAAQWSLDMRTHEPLDLFHTYLKPALRAVGSSRDPKLHSRVHHAMAKFADIQINNIDSYRRGRKYEEMVASIQEAENHIQRLQNMKEARISAPKKTRRQSRLSSAEASGVDKVVSDLDYFIRINMKQISMDKGRLEKLNEAYKRWQILACEHYAACLRRGSVYDLHSAFRMVALWLDSGDMRNTITCHLNGQDDKSATDQAIQVPMEKLLPLAPQLFSRLDHSENMVFQRVLSATIVELSGAHPAHCLWSLLALTNAQRTSGTEEERLSSLYRGNKHKKDAAIDILGRLEAKHGKTVSQMKKVADAYIALSEISGRQKKSGLKMDISRYDLLKLGQLSDVAVPTMSLPLRATTYCHNLPTIAGFEKMATVCAGLSKPLKVKCIGSDGVLYSQMVKGRDDLRGDAVMEQLFSIMNSLLEQDIQASKRNLHIRTYRIIPLSPFSGIMQFVSNTMQFKELLVEGQEAATGRARGHQKSLERGRLHERYRPQDFKNISIAERAFDEHRKKFSLQKRLNYFRVVWKRFQPVFRYFFLEEWPDASEWFTHQLAYSHSTAVISIVGFILGLGDRHLSNILMDVRTGEVVHIDFGIAFEQGKLLPLPEHMPFRLTRDLVDGFGISGVEGVFRKSCEITLSVMRRYKDVLLTVVEVLLHDPMFNWGLTPEDVLREQLDLDRRHDSEGDSSPGDSSFEEIALKVERNSKASGSREAHRALNRISEKLDGLEGTERLSTEAHVARLIDEAQAFHVIAPVYPGWAPWL